MITLLVVVLIPLIVVASGAINLAGSNPSGAFAEWMSTLDVERSVAMRALTESHDFSDKRAAITDGLEHYRAMCVRCHGGAESLLPQPINDTVKFVKWSHSITAIAVLFTGPGGLPVVRCS